MTREEKLKLLLDTGGYDFIKYIPKENMWKLIFALAYIEEADDEYQKEWCEVYDMAIKTLEQKSETVTEFADRCKECGKNRWIPVSERLPEEREWYLAVFKEKDTDYQLIPRIADYIGKNDWRIIDEDGLCKEYRDILECVAWMPLPKPYKPQAESEE